MHWRPASWPYSHWSSRQPRQAWAGWHLQLAGAQAPTAAAAAAGNLHKQPAQNQQMQPAVTQAVPAAADASPSTQTLLQQVLRRLEQLQQQQQHQPQPNLNPMHGLPAELVQQLGRVDVVYLVVNGSDPLLAQELRDFGRSVHTFQADNPLRPSRFDAGRDELRYSLRSLEMYLPWFRHVYIVTNGQVRLTQPALVGRRHADARHGRMPHPSVRLTEDQSKPRRCQHLDITGTPPAKGSQQEAQWASKTYSWVL